MINNSNNINKTNSHLSPQIIEHKKDHDIWIWIQILAWDRHLNLMTSLYGTLHCIFGMLKWLIPSYFPFSVFHTEHCDCNISYSFIWWFFSNRVLIATVTWSNKQTVFFFILIFSSRIITMVFILGSNQRHTTGVFLGKNNKLQYDHMNNVIIKSSLSLLINNSHVILYNHYLCVMTCWIHLVQVNFDVQTNVGYRYIVPCLLWFSEWLLFNANWPIFQLYHSESKLIRWCLLII